MTELGMSKKQVEETLRYYIEEIEKIMSFFEGDPPQVPRERVPAAQEALKILKKSLESEYRRRNTVKAEKVMSKIEKSNYFPAISEAFTHIHVKTNSQPIDRWLSELYEAQDSLHFYLNH